MGVNRPESSRSNSRNNSIDNYGISSYENNVGLRIGDNNNMNNNVCLSGGRFNYLVNKNKAFQN